MEGFLGEIRMFPERYSPSEWAFCDGQTLEIVSHYALFNLLGNAFGGDGVRTFALPRLADPRPRVRYIICIEGMYPYPRR
jgi:microcystin-dependent protein